MTMHIRDATVWKTASPKVRDAGVWKQVQTGSVKDAGVWKTFFNNASYTASSNITSGTEPFTATITVATTGVPNNAFITYQIVAEYGTPWSSSDDYNVSNGYDNTVPTGNITVDGSGNAYFYINVLDNDPAEGTEYFYVKFYAGYNANVDGPSVAQTQIITVTNKVADCIWALYGRPEWC